MKACIGMKKSYAQDAGWPDGPLGPPTEVSCCRLGGGAEGEGSSYEIQVTPGSELLSDLVKYGYVAVTFSKVFIIMEKCCIRQTCTGPFLNMRMDGI